MSKYVTKKGEHGTLYLYDLWFTDESDPFHWEEETSLWAYDREDAVERLFEDGLHYLDDQEVQSIVVKEVKRRKR